MKLIVIPPPPLEFSTSGPVHMILGQLTDPGVNFALVHVLTPVTVQMSFLSPWGNFERQLPVVQQ